MDKPRFIGAAIGFVLSLIFIVFNWKIMISVAGLSLAGYLIGIYFESRREIKEKFRELISLLFR